MREIHWLIDELLCLERREDGVFVRVGSVLCGNKPIFEMHDETWVDRLKKKFSVIDHTAFHDGVDKRFFIKGHPLQLYPLQKTTSPLIATLPPGSTIRSDGAIITIHLPAGANLEAINDAIEIGRTLGKAGEEKLAFFENLSGAKRQPRSSWDQCPDPQFIVYHMRVPIEVRVPWFSPVLLRAHNANSLPDGILSLRGKGFYPYNDSAKPLLKELENIGGQELAPALGDLVSLYSNMGDKYLGLSLYSDLSEQAVQAGVELLARLAAPKDNGPFR